MYRRCDPANPTGLTVAVCPRLCEHQGVPSTREQMSADDHEAITALISDLHWQIDQMRPRGIKDAAGNPYNPSYYKRGLQAAIDRGGLAVADYIRRYLSKPPSEGYRKLEDANSLDLACEALIADPDKPYAHLFTNAERKAARERLAHHLAAIERRNAARAQRIAQLRSRLPSNLDALRAHAAGADDPERAIAINGAIIEEAPDDIVALNRLGRAYEALGRPEAAKSAFRRVLEYDPTNPIASRRLSALERIRP
jgi:tetratricopeptide (TPR) repeat protein